MLKKMRQCRLNFADNRYDCEAGIIGEHYATELIVTPPAIMPTEAVYRLCFEPGGLSEIILQTTDGAFSYPLPSAVTATSCCCVTLIGYVGSEQVYKSRMVRLRFSQTADGDNSIDLQQPGIVDEVNQNTAARHSHANKAVLDKFAESKDGKPTYDGKALGDGSEKEIFKIPVTITELEDPADGESFKVEHTMTLAELEAATKEGKTLTVLADRGGVTYNLPLFYYVSGTYCFYAMVGSTAMYVVVGQSGDEGETPKEVWQYIEDNQIINARDIYYHNSNNASLDSAQKALDKLLTDSHTHANKDTLDKLSVADGILTYDGKSVGGSEDFIIQMAVNDAGELVSCKTIFGQVDAAYKAGKNLIVQATVSTSDGDMDYLLPLIGAAPNVIYAFGLVNYMSTVYATVTSPEIDPDSEWQYDERDFGKELEDLFKKSHTHVNKDTLDKLSDLNGKLQYNGSDIPITKNSVVTALGYTPQAVSAQVATGSNITLADNTEYRLTDVSTLTLTYPTGSFECWMSLTFAESGNITVTLPAETKYIGSAPDFKNGETWELSFKDKVLAAQKVGEGT